MIQGLLASSRSEALSAGSEMLLCKCPARTGLEVLFELMCFGVVRKPNADCELPGLVFVRVDALPRIMLIQTPIWIGCCAHIMALRGDIALENIDVLHLSVRLR